MDLADILSHTSAIRGVLDSIEAVVGALVPGAAPVVAAVQAVEGPALNAAATLAGAKPDPVAVPAASQSAADTSQGAADSAGAAPWEVTDTTAAAQVLFGPAGRDECERWANVNCPSGFSLRPVQAPAPAAS